MFRFKQFTVQDDRCAMKVGTDGVLLGAWVAQSLPDCLSEWSQSVYPGHSAFRVLDIGTGSGLIALMLAQKLSETPSLSESPLALSEQGERLGMEERPEWSFRRDGGRGKGALASIFAIDIDPEAVAQAAENFAASPWSAILHAHHSSLQEWNLEPLNLLNSGTCHPSPFRRVGGFSLIVSNPPYFVDSLKNPDLARQTARHTDTLSYDELISCSARLLVPGGHLALILPIEAESTIIALAQSHHLYPIRLCRVHGSARKPAKRVMLLFQKSTAQKPEIRELKPETWNLKPETLILMDEHGARSAAYATLCKDYYL